MTDQEVDATIDWVFLSSFYFWSTKLQGVNVDDEAVAI